MAKKQGLPSRFAKMGFAKGWAAYRAATGKRKKPKVHRAKGHARDWSVGRAAKKTRRKARSVVSYHKAPGRPRGFLSRLGGSLRGRAAGMYGRAKPGLGSMAKNLGLNLGGAVVSGALIRQLPITNAKARSAAQAIAGVLTILFAPRRFAWAHELGEGALIAGGFGLVRAFAPDSPVMAGEEMRIQYVPQYMDRQGPRATNQGTAVTPPMLGAPASGGFAGYGNANVDVYNAYA